MQVSLWLLWRQLCKYFSYSLPSIFHPFLVLGFLALMLMDGAAILPLLSLIVFTTITSFVRYFSIAGIPKKKRKIEARASWRKIRDPLSRRGFSRCADENCIPCFFWWLCTSCFNQPADQWKSSKLSKQSTLFSFGQTFTIFAFHCAESTPIVIIMSTNFRPFLCDLTHPENGPCWIVWACVGYWQSINALYWPRIVWLFSYINAICPRIYWVGWDDKGEEKK